MTEALSGNWEKNNKRIFRVEAYLSSENWLLSLILIGASMQFDL